MKFNNSVGLLKGRFFLLILLIVLIACSHSVEDNYSAGLLSSLDEKVQHAYEKGDAVLLFAYNDSDESSEAYADWSAYLNNISATEDIQFYTRRLNDNELKYFEKLVLNEKNFSVFVKDGKPSYFYEGFIVEPQVYRAVWRTYKDQPLDAEDKAFLPSEINFK